MANVKSITPLQPADFTPDLGNYKTLQPFRYWCQKVLPLVYDDSLSYYELLCKVVDYLNKTMEDVETLHGDITNLHTAYEELQSYVNNYFSTLDVQKEINNKLDNMASSGELYEIIRRYTDPIVNEQNGKINVLKARMDTFASLPEGSTSGDAELTDIRVGYYGEVYPSAGDAVRKQVSKLNVDLGKYSSKYYNYELGGIDTQNGTDLTNTIRIRTNAVKMSLGQTITVDDTVQAILIKYDAITGIFVGVVGQWVTGGKIGIVEDAYYRMMIRKSDNTDITDMLSTINRHVYIDRMHILENDIYALYEKNNRLMTQYADERFFNIKEVYFDKSQNIELCLGTIRKKYKNPDGTYQWSVIITDKNGKYTYCAYNKKLLPSENAPSIVELVPQTVDKVHGYALIDWKSFEDGTNFAKTVKGEFVKFNEKAYDINYSPSISNYIDRQKINTHKHYITIIDDDTDYNGIHKLKAICDDYGIKCTFACVTSLLNPDLFDNAKNLKERLLQYQREGFHIATHSYSHWRWYKNTTSLDTTKTELQGAMFTPDECESDLIKAYQIMVENGFMESNCIVYPGTSWERDGISDRCMKWSQCGFLSGNPADTQDYNNKYRIGRIFIVANDAQATLETYKRKIDEAYDSGRWLVLGTHTSIPSEFSESKVRAIIQYAQQKGFKWVTANEGLKYTNAKFDLKQLGF